MLKVIEFVTHCDRWYRLFLENFRRSLVYLNISDLNALQAFLLYHLGHQSLRVTQVAMSDVCLGSNPSYNLKKMLSYGYLYSRSVESDRRALLIALSPKGLEVHRQLHLFFERQMDYLKKQELNLQPIEDFLVYGKMVENILMPTDYFLSMAKKDLQEIKQLSTLSSAPESAERYPTQKEICR